LAWAWACAH